MPVPTITWEGELFSGYVQIIDQTLLPGEYKLIKLETVEAMWEAIRTLRVRGAPALGVAGALGTLLGIRDTKASNTQRFLEEMEKVIAYLGTSRPTAVNLFWALDRMKRVTSSVLSRHVPDILDRLFDEGKAILEEDRQVCRQLGKVGRILLTDGIRVLTHCNAGALATADYGTALAVVYGAKEEGKKIHVYADETRPLLQGARLTAWELNQAGIDTTLICDNMAAVLMKEKKVDIILVGADRIAANGDVANKIGTYGLAVLASVHNIPFYSVAPTSTFDLSISDGSQIKIEERSGDEIRTFMGVTIAPASIKTYSPAFDVTPNSYITGIVTEKGIFHPPFDKSIKANICSQNSCCKVN